MRIRATVAAVSGALALSTLAVPAAHADTVDGDTQITSVVVNSGKPVVLGISAEKSVTLKLGVSDPAGIYDADAALYHGTNLDTADAAEDSAASCGEHTETSYTCSLSYTFTPGVSVNANSQAGTWKVYAWAVGTDGDSIEKDAAATFKVLRYSKLSVNATPEPVKKGATITVYGTLSRANWETLKYSGYTSQSVKLQFRKYGTSTYSTVKTVTSGTGGALKTTVTASYDGYWRWYFPGSSTTASSKATGDYVDVQ